MGRDRGQEGAGGAASQAEPAVDPTFAIWLRQIRTARGWSRAGLSQLLNYEATTVKLIEGRRRSASKPFLQALARLLEVPVSSLATPALRIACRRPPPAPTTSLIGRDADVAAVVAMLDRHRVVTVAGPAGVGKSRVGRAVLSRIAPLHGAALLSFPQAGDPATLIRELRRVLELPAADAEDVESIVDALRDLDLVIAADDFDNLVAAGPLLAHLVASTTRLRVLITSREAVRLAGEAVHHLQPLATVEETRPRGRRRLAPATELFLERAGQGGRPTAAMEAELGVVTAICEALDGLPLAIELAAASCQYVPLEELLHIVTSGLEFPVPGRRDAPDHHRTLRDAIGWTYSLLPVESQRLFDCLSLFEGSFTPEAGASVGGIDPRHRFSAVGELARRSFLQSLDGQDGSRFVMLNTLRRFGRDQLEASGALAGARQRHAHYFLTIAEAAAPELVGPAQREWFAALERQQDDLDSALTWLLANDPSGALRMTASCWRLWWRSRTRQGRTWLERALEMAGDLEEPVAVEARNGAGVLMRTMGDVAQGQAMLLEALAMARRLGDLDGAGLALLNLAAGESVLGHHECAYEYLTQSAEAYRGRSLRSRGHVQNGFGILLGEMDRVAESRKAFETSLALFEELGDDAASISLANLGWLAVVTGDNKLAMTHLTRAVDIARKSGDDRSAALALLNLALAARRLGRTARATDCLQEALLTFRQIGDKRSIVESYEQIALVFESRGDASTSIRLWAVAERLRLEMGTPALPADRQERDRGLERARARAGSAAADAAWREGHGLTVDEAIDLALRVVARNGRSASTASSAPSQAVAS